MKQARQRRNRSFSSNLVLGSFDKAVEEYVKCETLVSKINTIDKPYLQHINKKKEKGLAGQVPVWLLKSVMVN